MKTTTFICSLIFLLSFPAYSQNEEAEQSLKWTYGINPDISGTSITNDSLERQLVSYNKLSLHFADSIKQEDQIKFDNAAIYSDADYYYVAVELKKDQWVSLWTPWLNPKIDFINIDKKGKPELIVSGYNTMYGSGGGNTCGGTLIFDMNQEPALIFKVIGYYSEEIFGNKTDEDHWGEGASYTKHETSIKIQEGSIIIGNNPEPDPELCNFTDIPPGTYQMKNGRIVKVKQE